MRVMRCSIVEAGELLLVLRDLLLQSSRQHGILDLFTCEHLVELTHIECVGRGNLRDELRLDSLVEHVIDIQVFEPRVRYNLVQAAGRSESVLGCLSQALLNEVLTLWTHGDAVTLRVREEDWLILDQLVHLLIVLTTSIEWRESDNHLISQNAEGPPIDGEGVTLLLEDFRSQVFGRTAERVSLLITFQDLGETEVRQADITIFTH